MIHMMAFMLQCMSTWHVLYKPRFPLEAERMRSMPGSSRCEDSLAIDFDQLESANVLPLLLNRMSHTARPAAGHMFI